MVQVEEETAVLGDLRNGGAACLALGDGAAPHALDALRVHAARSQQLPADPLARGQDVKLGLEDLYARRRKSGKRVG